MKNMLKDVMFQNRKISFDKIDSTENNLLDESSSSPQVNRLNTKKSIEANNNKLDPVSDRKRTNQSSDMKEKYNKKLKTDTSELMNRLEEFSNIWNDCPDNPTYDDGNDIEYVHLDREHNKNELEDKSSVKTKLTSGTKKNVLNLVGNERTGSELADFKRKKAVIEHRQLYVDKQKLIKQALSGLDGKKINKKVVFTDNEECELNVQKVNAGKERPQLFEGSDDSEDDRNFKVNPQFEGKKGQKLLELQSKYASDSRFNLDTRFYESGSEAGEENEDGELENHSDEKEKQLAILGSIVNREIKPLSTLKKSHSKQEEHRWMVRFDPTREDHSKYILKPNEHNKNLEDVEKKKKRKTEKGKNKELQSSNTDRVEAKEENTPVVSDEKFYSVKEDLKDVLKTEKKTEFSLLKLFGSKETQDTNPEGEKEQKMNKLKYKTKNPFKYDSSDSEAEEEIKESVEQRSTVSNHTAPSTWRTTFFFTDNDSRIQEALEFLKAPESQEDGKEFAEKRKILKDFIKNKFKNNHRKNGLFKKKLGGLKRKLVSTSKLKKR